MATNPVRLAEGLLHSHLTRTILGGVYAVYTQLGPGFLESVYEASLEIELIEAGQMVKRQEEIKVFYRSRCVGRFMADLLVDDRIILELKAIRAITPVHEAQILNLLKATQAEVGLILNFGPKPEFKRLVFSNSNKTALPRIHAEERG